MTDPKPQKIWNDAWKPETHESDYALKRINSAKSAKLTPVEIDTTDFFGYFQGSHGRYQTFLDYCPCGDFRRSKLPCKHIYRLAIELELMDVETKNDKSLIPVPQNERLNLDETINLIETLSADAQHELLVIASHVRTTHPLTAAKSNNDNITELLAAGIITEPDTKLRTPTFGTKDQVMDLLDNENITYKKSQKKSELIELCKEHIPEKAKQKFGEQLQITIPSKFSAVKIHHYLHRKYDRQIIYNEETGQQIFGETPLLETKLPDDDVTAQLTKHGYYLPK